MKLAFRFVVSAGAFLVLLRFISVTELKESILSIPLVTLAAVCLIFFAGQVLSSYKWWLLARSGGLDAPWLLAFKAYFLGMFVNCFGVGTVGGDLARAVVLGNGPKRHAVSLASVFADRVHGLTILAGIGAFSMTLFGRDPVGGEFLLLLPVGIAVFTLGWYFGPGVALALLPKQSWLHKKTQEVVRVFPRDLGTVGVVSLVSLVFHLLQISLHQIMAAGFGLHIPWPVLLAVIPVVNILSSLPISWNGLGVRENGYIFFLAPWILSREQAVAFGAMWLFAIAVSSVIGGLVALFAKDARWREKQLHNAGQPFASDALDDFSARRRASGSALSGER